MGACARLLVARRLPAGRYPWGTLAVNVLGSFGLGLVAAAIPGEAISLAVGTGACGAFTTFSSFAYEAVRRFETGDRAIAAVHAGANLGGALAALWAAFALVAAL